MGVFHYRCAVTGLSLNGAECVAIWVAEVAPDRWVPASLPIRGSYNAYGTIDMIHRYTPQAWHTERVFRSAVHRERGVGPQDRKRGQAAVPRRPYSP